jgi:two-component system, OmpR family, sensor kinase
MSLRLRLTLAYSGMLSAVVLLLSIIVYALVSLLFTDFVDNDLQKSAQKIIPFLQADGFGALEISSDLLPISDDYYIQVWSRELQLVDYSANASDFSSALDETTLPQNLFQYSDVFIDEVMYRVITVPLVVDGVPYGVLQVGIDLTEIRYTLRLLQLVFSISAMFAISVSVIVGWIVVREALSPLETMAEVAKQITSTDDLSRRIPVSTGQSDEISALALSFNQTFVRLERLFNAQRRFLADVSHELRTPLTVIKGNVGLMRLMKSFDEESLIIIEKEVDRLTRLVGDLLLMAQAESGKLPLMLANVAVDEVLLSIFDEMKVLSGGMHDIQLGEIEPVEVNGDRDRIKQVLLNLGVNAVNYTPEGGLIQLSLTSRGNWAEIVISDEGQGIPEKEMGYLFERFYRGEKSRTRASEKVGYGLGLPIAYWIVRNHGGRIDVESQEGIGTTFTIWLPKTQAEVPTQPLIKDPSEPGGLDSHNNLA